MSSSLRFKRSFVPLRHKALSIVILASLVLTTLQIPIISFISSAQAAPAPLSPADTVPSVAVNKYLNAATDTVELLVIQDNLDMRGMIVKDFSSSMANDNGGSTQFSTNALWSSVRAGTLIVLRNDTSATDVSVGGSDYNLDVGMKNTTYFSNLAGSFDIAAVEMVMIKAAGSGAAGTTGSIHALAGGTAGAQFTNAPTPKLIASGQSGTNQFVYAKNSTQSIADFNGTDAAGAATGLTFGVANNASNTAFINSLRNASPSSTNPSGTGLANPASVAPTGTTLLTVKVTPGTNPASTAHTVSANLTAIGGVASQSFYDDGSNGDVTAGDNIFSFSTAVANGTSGGAKSLPVTVTETSPNSRTGSTTISLTVLAQTNPSGTGSANPSSVLPGASSLLTVNVTPGTNPASTLLAVTADLSSIGGPSAQTFNGSNNSFTFSATVSSGTTPGPKTLPVIITDGENRSGSASISMTVEQPPPPIDHVVISQVYGGGGNSGAVYRNDFVELYNPGTVSFDLTGWSLQYASFDGSGWSGNIQPLGGTIAPGQYYLVALASGGAVGAQLPPANITGEINMSATHGKIALVSNFDPLSGDCPLGDPDLVDFVGYGTDVTCNEGSTKAPAPSATKAIFRKGGGGIDSNNNGADFVVADPSPRQSAPIVEIGPSIFSTDPRSTDTRAPRDTSITLNFTEPVNVDEGWFNIQCATSGLHNDATVAGSSKTYVITPNTSFVSGEQCTVTINKDSIHDQDLDDSGPNTDTLTANYTWTFTTSTGATPPYTPDVHLTMGYPSNAVADINQPNNYLMVKPAYALSYNRNNGTPNWVSWHLDESWTGNLARVDSFRPDPAVPSNWYRVQATDYAGTGFDRGHMTPNADRDNENLTPINQETFLMSNMVPQAPDNNQGPWANMEGDLRKLFTDSAGNKYELYVISGPGYDPNKPVTTIANGHVRVPDFTWKVALVLPKGDDDVSRVNAATKTIAVIMPNAQGIRGNDWRTYLVSVDQVEAATGYDFFSNVPDAIENSIEAGINGVNPPGTEAQFVTTGEDTPKQFTLTAASASNNPLTYTIVNQPSHGTLTGTGAEQTYTPASDYVGIDSFTFRASDGQLNSNVSTVTITVTEINKAPVANNDAKSTQEDVALSFSASDLVSNDSVGEDNDAGQTLTVTSVTATGNAHGSVTLDNGQITYTPDADYNGPASFDYQVCDNGTTNGVPDSKCATATVSVTVTAVNDAPTANAQVLATDEDSSMPITLSGSDAETAAGSLGYTVTANPSHGTLTGTGPNLTYAPAADYNGSDSFQFTITDTGDGSATASTSAPATVSITINPVNDAPVANNQSVSTVENSLLRIVLTGSDIDGDALSFTVVSGPANGALTGTAPNLIYTPNATYKGADSFTFTVGDGHINSTGTVSINVLPNTGTGSNIGVTVSGTTLNFENVTVPGTTTVAPIQDPAAVGEIPDGSAVSELGAYEVQTTAQFSGPVTIAFHVPDSISLTPSQFNDLRILHNVSGTLMDVTASTPARNYDTRTIYAVTGSFSPFYLVRSSNRIKSLVNKTQAYKSGSTIPVKAQLLNKDGANLSSGNLMLTVRALRLIGASTAAQVNDSGNANPDFNFRYDPTLGGTGGGYIYNLSSKELAPGKYVLSFYAGSDHSFFYTLTFEVK